MNSTFDDTIASDDAASPSDDMPSTSELELTLQRLVRRIAMLIQCEMCVFLLHDRENDTLVARPPALGIAAEHIRQMRLPILSGLTGEVFRSGQNVVLQDVGLSTQVSAEWMEKLGVRNLIAQPLIAQHHDAEGNIASREIIGVLYVANKRDGAAFTEEDEHLLSAMSHQFTAVIANAHRYLDVSEEKAQIAATLHSLLAGIVMVESSGHISLINAAAQHIFGLENKKPEGRLYSEVIPHAAIVAMIRDTLENSRETQIEVELLLPGSDEPHIFQGQTAFVRSDETRAAHTLGVVAIFNDITEIRNVERMKTAFVSTVSHELRTPLTSIKGFIATLLQDTEGFYDEPTRQEFYGIINSECDRLQRLIEDLLNVSRIESGRALQMHWTEFDVRAALEKAMQAQSTYTTRHALVLDVPAQLPRVLGDADKFDQIMMNLLSNAVKYSPSGGTVTVSAHCDASATHPPKTLTVSVRDEGIGIPPDKQQRIFEKFERLDDRDTRQAGGTGIGLFLVKHLIERHEGEIWVESQPGQGSTFSFRIPLRPRSAVSEMLV